MQPKPLTDPQKFAQRIMDSGKFDKHPYYGLAVYRAKYGFVVFEFWDDNSQNLFSAVCIPDDSHVVNGLAALLEYFADVFSEITGGADGPARYQPAVIVPGTDMKTTFPEDFTKFEF